MSVGDLISELFNSGSWFGSFIQYSGMSAFYLYCTRRDISHYNAVASGAWDV